MSLDDRRALEVNKLCNELIDETISEPHRATLEEYLAESEDARQFYVRSIDLSASLGSHASEMQIEAAEVAFRGRRISPPTAWLWLALAASLVLASTLWLDPWTDRSADRDAVSGERSPEIAEFVARITGTRGDIDASTSIQIRPGYFVQRGEKLDLGQGFTEITFDSGAVVLLEGPATLEVNSAWDLTLRRGALTAHVPPQAIGFRVSNPAVDVVDLGTKFSMVADDEGTTEVFVLKGEVEAVPCGHSDEDSLLLRTNESRRFATSGVTGTKDHKQMFARFRSPVELDSLSEPVNYVHWSFDSPEGGVLNAVWFGFPPSAESYALKLRKRTPEALAAAESPGVQNNALRFDGKQVAKAGFPGLSSSFPRTIAFWVKIPENASLSTAYSIVAWRGDSKKLASRPVHVGWNRNPSEGPLGAIRTDFSGGHAIGTTTLRDGRWHHITVIFLTGEENPDAPVQVKQYVDGRLESNIVTPGPRLSIGGNFLPVDDMVGGDQLWLGCRLGGSGPKRGRFVGEIDELFIADHSIEPGEVVRLMDGEEPASAQDLAAFHKQVSSAKN